MEVNLTPEWQLLVGDIGLRFTYMDAADLLGGAATVILGIFVILIGLTLSG